MQGKDPGTWSTAKYWDTCGGAVGRYLLALDLGTSSVHCLLTDSLGNPVAGARSPMSYFTPPGCAPLAKEFNPDGTLAGAGQAVASALRSSDIRPDEIAGIGITGQRQGMVFLDRGGTELYCGPNADLQAVFEGAAIDEEHGDEFYAATGHHPSMLFAPARLRWFRENRPYIYERIVAALTVPAWLAYRLTGSKTAEPALEGEAGLLDVNMRQRDMGLLEKLGVSESLLPCLVEEGDPAGGLSRNMADTWGLKPETPVFLAGPDTQCGLLGMGLRVDGEVGVVLGWSGALQVLTASPCFDEKMRTWVGCYPMDGLWVAEANLGASGNAYRWLKDTLLGNGRSFEAAEHLAAQAAAASEGVMSFLGPGPVSAFKMGLRMGGLLFPTPLDFQETSPGQLLRAALENIAYGVKANLEVLEEVTDRRIESLSIGGGMAASPVLATSLANVLGFPVKCSVTPQVSAMGAALVTAGSIEGSRGEGSWGPGGSFEAGQAVFRETEPESPSDVAQQQECYQQWLETYRRLDWE